MIHPSPDITHEQRAAIVATVHARAAAFGRTLHQKNAAEKRVKALEDELAKYKKSEPGVPKGQSGGGGGDITPSDNWEQQLEGFAHKA